MSDLLGSTLDGGAARRSRTILVALLVVLAAAASAFAAPLTKDPLSLALRRQDCPPGTDYSLGRLPDEIVQGLRPIGVHGGGAYGACDYARTASGSLTLTFLVLATVSAGQARTAFASFAKELAGPSRTKVTLPVYGDQQLAVVERDPAKAELVVRKRTVVWELSLAASGSKVQAKAQAIAALEKFARKQKARVGAG